MPDLLTFLHWEPECLLDRIRRRHGPGDDTYGLTAMRRLGVAYDKWREAWQRSPAIDIDVFAHDVRQPDEIGRLVAAVNAITARAG